MKHEAAQRVLAEAQADARLTAKMQRADQARNPADGWQVHLVLRGGRRQLTVHSLQEWYDIQLAWREM